MVNSVLLAMLHESGVDNNFFLGGLVPIHLKI